MCTTLFAKLKLLLQIIINSDARIGLCGCACVECYLLSSLPTDIILLLARQGPHFTCLYIPIISEIMS